MNRQQSGNLNYTKALAVAEMNVHYDKDYSQVQHYIQTETSFILYNFIIIPQVHNNKHTKLT